MAVGGGALVAAAWAVGAGPRPEGFLAWGLTLSLGPGIAAGRPAVAGPPAGPPALGPRPGAHRLEERGGFGNLLVAAEEALRRPERWPGDDPVGQELRRRLFDRADGFSTWSAPRTSSRPAGPACGWRPPAS